MHLSAGNPFPSDFLLLPPEGPPWLPVLAWQLDWVPSHGPMCPAGITWAIVVSLLFHSLMRPKNLAPSRHTIHIDQKETSLYEGNNSGHLVEV